MLCVPTWIHLLRERFFSDSGEIFACSDVVFQVVVSLYSFKAEFSVSKELL